MAQSAAGAPSHVDRSKVVGLLAVTKARKEEEGKVVPRSQIKGEAGALGGAILLAKQLTTHDREALPRNEKQLRICLAVQILQSFQPA